MAAHPRQGYRSQPLRLAATAPARERPRLLCLSRSAALALIRSMSVIACQRVPRRCPVRRARPAASSSRRTPSHLIAPTVGKLGQRGSCDPASRWAKANLMDPWRTRWVEGREGARRFPTARLETLMCLRAGRAPAWARRQRS
jgi:hypothetical protein